MTTTALLPVEFEVPQLPAPPYGLYQVITWAQDGTEPLHWLPSGVIIRPFNVSEEDGFGIWGEDWCADPNDIAPKRPVSDPISPT
jgi:hypothetical protein